MTARLDNESLVRILTVVLILSATISVLLAVDNLLLAFVLAVVITYLLTPFVNAMERAGATRSIAVLCLYLTIGALLALVAWFLVPTVGRQIAGLQSDLPQYIEGVRKLLTDLEKWLPAAFGDIFNRNTGENGSRVMPVIYNYLFRDLSGILSVSISTLILAPLFAFFMLIDGRSAVKKLIAIVPNDFFETALNLQYQINAQVGGFVRARLLESAIVAAIIWAGLMLIDCPYTIFLSAFAGLMNLVPYVGPVVGAIPAFLIAIINNSTGADLLLILAVYSVAQLIDTAFIVPLVVAKIVNLHAVIVIVVIIIGAQIGGILGMIISVPAASIIKLTGKSIYRHLVGFRT